MVGMFISSIWLLRPFVALCNSASACMSSGLVKEIDITNVN
jgi:hypothetical protein